MNRLDIISEITSRLAVKVSNLYLSVAPDTVVGPYCVIRQDDPTDTKTKDRIVGTRCNVLLIAAGKTALQVSGVMNNISTTFENVDTEVNGVGLKIVCDTPGKVESDGEGEFWQEVWLRIVVTY